jgi:hypothetical protein
MDGPRSDHTLVSYVDSWHRTVEFSGETTNVPGQERRLIGKLECGEGPPLTLNL